MKSSIIFGLVCIAVVHAARYEVPLNHLRFVRQIPIGGVPIGGVPIGGVPIGGVPIGGMPIGGMPIGTLPIGGIGGVQSVQGGNQVTSSHTVAQSNSYNQGYNQGVGGIGGIGGVGGVSSGSSASAHAEVTNTQTSHTGSQYGGGLFNNVLGSYLG